MHKHKADSIFNNILFYHHSLKGHENIWFNLDTKSIKQHTRKKVEKENK